ncbi:thrombospondin type 3 repeat-containing protein, partial [Candidatus Ulvibacter alkanivorans]|uniref:thrombospondin type 3 repeat-containing protein n=1 Tax=Candidatus Ulvibacter alkanivorans TaxID=2267620 RepID=UPI001B34FCE1
DPDNDGVILKFDNCPVSFNPEQFDSDEDGRGDVCDDDTDGDNFSDKYEEEYGSNPNDKEVIPQVFVPYENDYSEWEVTGEIADKGTWAPALDKQETEFVQTRNNEEEKIRTVFIQEKDKHSDTIRVVAEEEETQFFPFVEERTLIPRESNRSQRTERCGAWTPDPLTIPKGTTFNQERECYSIFDVTLEFFTNAEEGEVVIGEVPVVRETGPFIRTSTNIGQKEKYEPMEDEFTPWVETDSFRSSESWLPSASGKTTSFTQFQNGEVEEERFKIVREKEIYTGTVREVSREKQTRWVEKQISRNVEALPGTWTNSGENCEGWTPSTSEYNVGESFTQ